MQFSRLIIRKTCLALVLLIVACGELKAASIRPGDLVVFPGAFGLPIIGVNPGTGAQTALTPGLPLGGVGIAVAGNGEIFFPGRDITGIRNVTGINPITGSERVISAGGLLVRPVGLATARSFSPSIQADIIVADRSSNGGSVIRINPTSGAQTLVSSDFQQLGTATTIKGIAAAANGDIFVLVFDNTSGGAIIRVNPITGAKTVVSASGILNPFLTSPLSLEIAANGDIIVVNTGVSGGQIVRVNPTTGAPTLIAETTIFTPGSGVGFAQDVAIAANGNLFIANLFPTGAPQSDGFIGEVNPGTGAQRLVSSGGNFAAPFGPLALDFFPGDLPTRPLLPTETLPDGFRFTDVISDAWFDPPTASGFRYTMTSGSLFTQILDFPTGFADFTVAVGSTVLGMFHPGDSVDFTGFPGGGVAEFTVSGINPLVDPEDPRAFPLQLAFNTPTASFDMVSFSPVSAVPEPGSFTLLGLGVLGLLGYGWRQKRKNGRGSLRGTRSA